MTGNCSLDLGKYMSDISSAGTHQCVVCFTSFAGILWAQQREVSIAPPTVSSGVVDGNVCSRFHGEDLLQREVSIALPTVNSIDVDGTLCFRDVLTHRKAVERTIIRCDFQRLHDRCLRVYPRWRRTSAATRRGVQLRASNT